MAGIDNAVFRPGAIRAAVEAVPAWLWLGAGVFLMPVVGGNRTPLRPAMPAIGLLDRLDGRRRVHADDFAVVHVRTDRPR